MVNHSDANKKIVGQVVANNQFDDQLTIKNKFIWINFKLIHQNMALSQLRTSKCNVFLKKKIQNVKSNYWVTLQKWGGELG